MTSFQQEILRVIEEYQDLSEEDFNRLALDTYAWQVSKNPVYRKFCETFHATKAPNAWLEIPSLPISAFKTGRVFCFDPKQAVRLFQTSGTTRAKPGKHYFEALRYYDAVIPVLFKRCMLPDRDRISVASLIPSVQENPLSSLSYLAGFVRDRFGTGRDFEIREHSRSRFEDLIEYLREQGEKKEPVCVLSTTLGLWAFLSFLEEKEVFLKLAPGSRIMDTGGSKGRKKEVDRDALLAKVRRFFHLEPEALINEYGMTELTTHFYDQNPARKTSKDAPLKEVPPWTRVRIMDPATDEEAPEGMPGLIRIWDLANQGSVLCLQTEDEGIQGEWGFKVLGRQPGSDLRGCSLTYEELEQSMGYDS